jgi:GT2 family glycosyltransferase
VTFGCVVLTQGHRPADLERAVRSLLDQEGVPVDAVVVGNAWEPEGLPDGVRGLGLAEDRGTSVGRNAGARASRGELLFFLDDDAALVDRDALARIAAMFEADPALGIVQAHVESRDGGPRSRDWVPRVRVGDPARSSDVTAVWEGALAIPRRVFDEVGGWPEEFRIIHEGIDLAWRVMDAGYRVHYAGEIVVTHPSPGPATGRHEYSFTEGAKNRVYVARRNLPLPLGVLYVAGFVLRTLPGLRSRAALRAAWRGYREGMRGDCGRRKPLHARTLWRMTRLGRPPVI